MARARGSGRSDPFSPPSGADDFEGVVKTEELQTEEREGGRRENAGQLAEGKGREGKRRVGLCWVGK